MPADGMKMSDLFLNPAARLLSHPDSASCVWINMNVGEWEENLTRLIKHNFGGNFAPGHLKRCGPLTGALRVSECWSPVWPGVACTQHTAPAVSGAQDVRKNFRPVLALQPAHLAAITTNITQ